MRSYSLLCIKTCHRRNIFAMGGMAAQIPVKNDSAANEEAFAKVRADKEREAQRRTRWDLGRASGYGAARARCFDAVMPQPNQIERKRDDVKVTRARPARFRSERTDHRSRLAPKHQRWRAISRSLAARTRRRAALQFDGRCRHRGNLARPGLAMDSPSARRIERWSQSDEGTVPAACSTKNWRR